MARKVLKVDFKDGVYLAGTVKQSVGVSGQTTPRMSLTGLTLVSSIEGNNVGVDILMNERLFFVPWTSIASCELVREEAVAEAAQKAVPGKR